ncbi:MAG: methyltransferase domain-containing protein [Chlorobi bacterium]|nr:methyltransferase domain-containing protein [Chlorobiota bacterium]
MAETNKPETVARRDAEGWYGKFTPADQLGIDIGCGADPINQTFDRWDKPEGDATFMDGVPDGHYHTVYASHILEHLSNPWLAVEHWYRILAEGGHLIVCVPHRDLYEKRSDLPSDWNGEHKWFFLPDESEAPCTLSLRRVVESRCIGGVIVHCETLSEGYVANGEGHPGGEYSIEIIVHKPIEQQQDDTWDTLTSPITIAELKARVIASLSDTEEEE